MDPGDDTLRLWETLLAAPPASRAAALLVHRGAAAELDEALDLPLATAETAALRELRDRTDGVVPTVVTCGGCGALLDVPLDVGALARSVDAEAMTADVEDTEVEGMLLRPPTSRDLVVALTTEDPARALRERCVRPASPDSTPDDPGVQAAPASPCARSAPTAAPRRPPTST